VVPVLCELANRDIVPILIRQARLFADDADLLGELAAALDPDRRQGDRARPPSSRASGTARVAAVRSSA